MRDTIPKMHVCDICGFMSTRWDEFEMVGNEKLCKPCIQKFTKLFYFEADLDISFFRLSPGLVRGRNIYQAHESLANKIGLENITVFREATAEDIARVRSESGQIP